MAVTTLDPATALIVIDLQKGIISMPTAHPIASIVQRAGTIADAFRRRGVPIVLVSVSGRPPGRTEQMRLPKELPSGFADLVSELKSLPDEQTVSKQTASAFTRTDLEASVRSTGVTQVVITGIATSMGVESTVQHAHELGFNVTLTVDAMTDMDAELHANSVANIFPRLGGTGTTAAILGLLEVSMA